MVLSRKMRVAAATALLGGGAMWSIQFSFRPPGPDQSAKARSSVPELRTAVLAGDHRSASEVSTVSGSNPREESLAAALNIPNRKRRLLEVTRQLQEWALCDPPAAFEWACSQAGTLRGTAIVAVLSSAAGKPAAERQLGSMLRAEDPGEADELGLAVVHVLTNAGHFEAALRFVDGVNADAGADWQLPIFRAWGTNDPANALLALQTLDATRRDAAFQSLMNGWAVSQPNAACNYVLSLPEGQERSTALSALGEHWALQDPAALADWLANVPRSPDLDPLIAAMLVHSDGINRPPSLAAAWADGITDPELRFSTMEHLVREWGQSDAADAKTYVQLALWLTTNQRLELTRIINTASLEAASN